MTSPHRSSAALQLYVVKVVKKRTQLVPHKKLPYPTVAVARQRLSGMIDLLRHHVVKIEVLEGERPVAFWQIGGHGIQSLLTTRRGVRHEKASAKQGRRSRGG